MGDTTKIEWTDATWNPLRGCTRVSEGCRNCYAERLAARMSKPGMWGHGFAEMTPAGPRWTGRVELVESRLTWPITWRGAAAAREEHRPSRIFVSSTSDVFHEDLPDEAIDRIFAVMSLSHQHTFQLLTKRPRRMLEYFTRDRSSRISAILRAGDVTPAPRTARVGYYTVPLENVWLGVSVEDQATADERIPLLQATPAAVRFVSYEPALAPVDFDLIDGFRVGDRCGVSPDGDALGPLHWIIVGGESGPGARPFAVAWARSTIAQCRDADVGCFVKQLGAVPLPDDRGASGWPAHVRFYTDADGSPARLRDRKGGDVAEWPEDLRVRELPR